MFERSLHNICVLRVVNETAINAGPTLNDQDIDNSPVNITAFTLHENLML